LLQLLVPEQVPESLQVSLMVQESPSSQDEPAGLSA
jgi:hypothetical protein